jgi:hypothetical protein
MVTGYELDDRGIEIRLLTVARDFALPHSARPAMGSIQPPIHWEPGALFPGIKQEERVADHSFSSSEKFKNVKLYLHSPIRIHGGALN